MLTFSFKGTNPAGEVIIDSSIESIDKLVEKLIKLQPDKILGLGRYSGRDQDKIRIEATCSNKFRNSTFDNSPLTHLSINHWIQPNDEFKLAKGIGNSWCNLVSYKIMSAINSGKLKSQYTFLHIPKNVVLDPSTTIGMIFSIKD